MTIATRALAKINKNTIRRIIARPAFIADVLSRYFQATIAANARSGYDSPTANTWCERVETLLAETIDFCLPARPLRFALPNVSTPERAAGLLPTGKQTRSKYFCGERTRVGLRTRSNNWSTVTERVNNRQFVIILGRIYNFLRRRLYVRMHCNC